MMLEKETLDALLRSWPAPGVSRSDLAPDDGVESPRADDIVRIALSSPRGAVDALDALLEAPALPAEPGEPSILVLREVEGDKKMAQDNESSGSSSGESTGAPSVPPAERKRTSLRAMAERANQAGAARAQSSSGGGPSSAPPSSTFTPVPARASVAPLSGGGSAPPPSRPVEASRDDSGVVNLKLVTESATPEQVAAAENVKPGQANLFEDEKPAVAAVAVIAQAPIAPLPIRATAPTPRRSNKSATAGVAIAVLGLAAAFAVMQRRPAQAPAPTVAESKPTTPAVVEATPPPAQPTPAPMQTMAAAQPTPTVEQPTAAQAPRAVVPGPLPTANVAPVAKSTAPDDSKVAAAAPTVAPASGKPGDLQSEMIRAAGGATDPAAAPAATPEPAAGNSKSQNIPEKPSQGSVQAAVGLVMGGAKACVAGGDDVSRATITFGSSGAVTSVSVTGWAAANGKSSCIQAALKGAKVGPFSAPSFSLGVPVRP